MRKIISFILALCMSGAIFGFGAYSRATAESYDGADLYFLEYIKSDTDLQNAKINFSYSTLYDETLEPNGRQYIFTVDGIEGYALMIIDSFGGEEYYSIEEIEYVAEAPFRSCDGLPVYIANGLYIEYKNNKFYNIAGGDEVGEQFVKEYAAKGFGYQGGGEFVEHNEVVNYVTKKTNQYSILHDLPDYIGSIDSSSCANTAGAVLIGYYDQYYENLISNYQTYVSMGSMFLYKSSSTEIENVTRELYVDMETDVAQVGTTFNGFQKGMEKFVKDKGYTYTSSNVFSWGKFNLDKYKSAVESNKPVALFLSGFAVVDSFNEADTYDTIYYSTWDKTHVVVGCGYKEVIYYDKNGKEIATRTYLKVSTALAQYGIGYLYVGGHGELQKAISTTIS